MIFTAVMVLYIVLFVAFLVSATCYIVLGERALRLFRSRYPAKWMERGEPTFVSFAVIGLRWWRPISAGNFFSYREYRALGDAELTRRGDIVRVLGIVAYATPIGWIALALIAIRFL